jgi:hypothetical protein
MTTFTRFEAQKGSTHIIFFQDEVIVTKGKLRNEILSIDKQYPKYFYVAATYQYYVQEDIMDIKF